MRAIRRRDFMKTVMIGGAILAMDGTVTAQHVSAKSLDLKEIGECKKVTFKAISELGWWDNKVLLADMQKAGGPKEAEQWTAEWDSKNPAGSCTLVEVEALNGSKKRFLIDTGWDPKYVDDRFKDEGIDKMLKNGEIEFLYITHEHLDHFWGLETTLKYNPDIKIFIPSTFHPPALQLISGAEFPKPGVKNAIEHKGQLVKVQVGEMTKLMDGVVSVGFDIPIILKIQGEQSLYFNVKDKGLVLCTGCCHQNILTFSDYAVKNLNGKDRLYGLYGGLHIAPFGTLGDEGRCWVDKMGSYGFKHIAANHCTGLLAVRRMVDLGYPVVKGSGKKGSQSDLYIGNGDTVVFG